MRQSKRGKETLRRESSMGEGLAVPNIIHTQFNLLRAARDRLMAQAVMA